MQRFASRSFRIYTRTGDSGQTSLFNGLRKTKDHPVFDALGAVDELNAAVGLARAHCEAALDTASDTSLMLPHILPQLTDIQHRLLDVGSNIATPQRSSSEQHLARVNFDCGPRATQTLEEWMDAMDEKLPPLREFILPGGGVPSASLHIARASCRRAERKVVPLVREGDCTEGVAIYLNRLSDYFFVAARFASMRTSNVEKVRSS